MLRKIAYAGVAGRSFSQGADLLNHLADLSIDVKQVERLTEGIGQERVEQRDTATAAFQALRLIDKFGVPADVTAPDLAVVMVDGGRLQIRDPAPKMTSTANDTAVADRTAAGPTDTPEPAVPEPAWNEPEPPAKGHWREDKVALTLSMTSVVSATDPCPEIPATFLDVVHIPKLARQLKTNARAGEDGLADPEESVTRPETAATEAVYEPPEVKTRQVLASRMRWPLFAPLVAAAAWALGFQGATRKAFVGDGSANNWRLHQRFFRSFVPILDFIHVLSYVYAAAIAGRTFEAGWICYEQWIRWVWQGKVVEVIAALQARQAELGMPAADAPETSPAQVVMKALSYLSSHQDKMAYDTYRKAGLPITSSLMESAVKQINQRVKGSEKFWSEEGSEAMLQLRADQLSDETIMETFWARRQAEATGQRRYRRSA